MKKLLLSIGLSIMALAGWSQKAQIDLPITWDDTANVDYTVIGFGDDTAYLAADPVNISNIVLKAEKPVGAQVWAGVVLGNDSLANPVPFSPGNTIMRAVVYAPDTGMVIRLKVENESNAAVSVETDAVTTVANGWDTLTFDFSNNATGTPAINFNSVYDKVAIFFDFGVAGIGDDFYLDYLEFKPSSNKAPISLPISWDDTANTDYTVIDFGGNASQLAVDPNNASNLVLQTVKTSGAQVWGGTTFGNNLAAPIPFSPNYTTLRAVVYSPDTGIVVKIKVEDATNPAVSVETDVTTTVANAWDTLSFNMINNSLGTPAINYSATYDKMSIFYDFGVAGTGKTYYVDHVEYIPAPPKVDMGLPITWDDTNNVNYTVFDFGGLASGLDLDPNNANNSVLKSTKTVGAQVWAGVSLGNNLAAAIPFTTSNTVVRAVVYAPDTGMVVKLKVEDATDPTKSVETDMPTTVANAWDTLSFDFTNQSMGTAAIDYTYTYDKMSIFYDFGVAGNGDDFYVDYIEFSGGTVGIINFDENKPSFVAYPNPANNQLNVRFEDVSMVESIQLINAVGQVVYSTINPTNNLEQIDLSNYAEGMYYLSIYSNNERITRKVVVSK